MSLRARLTAAFVAVVALPLLLAAIVFARTVPAQAQAHGRERVADARAVADSRLAATCQQLVTTAVVLARAASQPGPAVRAAVTSGANVAVLLGVSGAPVAQDVNGPATLVELARSTGDCRQNGRGGPQLIAARVALTALDGKLRGTAIAAVDLTDPSQLARITAGTPVRAAVVVAGQPAPADFTQVAARLSGGVPAGVVRAGPWLAAYLPLQGNATMILAQHAPDSSSTLLLLAAAAGLGLLLALVAGRQLATAVTRPLSALSAAATRVAGGDLGTRLRERPGTETGDLAVAFNRMTEALQHTITDLRASRDELHQNVGRLGSALSGTHDLGRILAVILETAVGSGHATAGALLLTTAGSDALYLAVGRGLDGRLPIDPRGARIPLSWQPAEDPTAAPQAGVVARVAATGESLHGPVGAEGLRLSPDEPQGRSVLAVPLRSGGRVTGVLSLYDPVDGESFTTLDVETVRTFVGQATVAIDNVLLHQEAQRLSITDALTGLWNYRYATLALGREVERALRFSRPMALLMLDLDRFKDVNDRYGHPRGDAVLIEVAQRLRSVVREVDVLSRYGGEELMLILPETDIVGAQQLADRVLETIRSTPMGGPGEEPVWMTTSIGIAVLPQHGDSPRAMLRAADSALYAAKAGGRDTARSANGAPSGADIR
ncbi:MAG TPA: diguanylate cyclase [Mycobacteriales bacterium]|nr:diguanylate cyclase [Mycobacteriales bacterium]